MFDLIKNFLYTKMILVYCCPWLNVILWSLFKWFLFRPDFFPLQTSCRLLSLSRRIRSSNTLRFRGTDLPRTAREVFDFQPVTPTHPSLSRLPFRPDAGRPWCRSGIIPEPGSRGLVICLNVPNFGSHSFISVPLPYVPGIVQTQNLIPFTFTVKKCLCCSLYFYDSGPVRKETTSTPRTFKKW